MVAAAVCSPGGFMSFHSYRVACPSPATTDNRQTDSRTTHTTHKVISAAQTIVADIYTDNNAMIHCIVECTIKCVHRSCHSFIFHVAAYRVHANATPATREKKNNKKHI